jgi:hypothetical protein
VHSVVAAVAPVPDEDAVALMTAYHHGLAAGLPGDEALASAAPQGSVFVALGSSWRKGRP